MRNRSLRGQPDRLMTLKRGSIRGLQSILSTHPSVSPYSSNSSIDGRVSPSPSFATSTHEVSIHLLNRIPRLTLVEGALQFKLFLPHTYARLCF
jgi:hypothetical protein